MKRIITFCLAAIFCQQLAFSQDVITKKDGTDIAAKVIEVSSKEVKYRLASEPDGVLYVVNKDEIFRIQYESGRTEVFNNKSFVSTTPVYREPVAGIVPGMKYNQLKGLYDYRDYYRDPQNHYSPGWIGVASFFIPGLGQMICDEVGRGFAWLGGYIGCYAVGGITSYVGAVSTAISGNPGFLAFNVLSYAFFAGGFALGICSIVDAVRIAKVKDMYENDLRRSYSFDLNLYPSVNYVQFGNEVKPTAGFTLAMRF